MPRARCRPRTPNLQLDFFPASPSPVPSTAPRWKALPDRTREAVTGLMTRLLIDHAGGGAARSGSDDDER